MSKSKPKFKSPSVFPKDEALKEIAITAGINYDDKYLIAIKDFIRRIDVTINLFKFTHHEANDSYIRQFNKNISDLLKWTGGKRSMVKSIIVRTPKGDVTFMNNDSLGINLFRSLFGGPQPNQNDYLATVNYLKSDELILPIKPFNHADSDELFCLVIFEARPLVKELYPDGLKTRTEKIKIKKLIMSTIDMFFPDVTRDRDYETNKKTFTKYLF